MYPQGLLSDFYLRRGKGGSCAAALFINWKRWRIGSDRSLRTSPSPELDSEARRTGNRLVEDAEEEARRIRDEIDALLGDARGASSPSSEEER